MWVRKDNGCVTPVPRQEREVQTTEDWRDYEGRRVPGHDVGHRGTESSTFILRKEVPVTGQTQHVSGDV